MSKFFQFFGLILILAGMSILISPALIYDWIAGNLENRALYMAAILARFILGLFLFAAASHAKTPIAIRIFALLSILTALLFLFMGQINFINLLNKLLPMMRPYAWVSGIISAGLGAFLIWTFIGREPE